ncbi:hypothetical protein ACFV9G_03990 [Nocardioides sp. NPDC059952]|uniref:hypothetical protein n=1 Tax=Nocardioides sp. NPDC059952 TaxID=3347014 RepID=UPI003647A795
MTAMTPPGTTPRTTAGFGGSTADVVLTIVLIVLGFGASVMASFFGAFSIMASDGCFETCNYTMMNIGVAVMVFTPWICWLVFGIWGSSAWPARSSPFSSWSPAAYSRSFSTSSGSSC